MTDSEARSDVVVALAEEFLERYRHGERPPLKEYIDRHPELASEICEVFPAMAMMEKIAIAEESLAGDAERPTVALTLQQLGDFRILREVGRGGMGIVYEAEQVSLGRHVALKVLPNKAMLDARHKRRFEREAKSAAKLHHTNIVPVFGFGEHDGLPYYVMQFIQGLAMNDVRDELIRQQGKSVAAPQREPSREVSAADLAHSLLAGRIQVGTVTVDQRNGDPTSQRAMEGESRSTADSSVSSDSSVVLPGQSDAEASKKQNYWQSIANVGLQVASALEYAHNQGVLHRDIKPSNLLLDRHGTVWVTDFGLAKADDQENLTHTGDILGTLRYMPPEAFEGKADRRSDVYALGLTLYELLAMRPAFGAKDRNHLINQVTTTEPMRLDKLNPAIPRDLVTIIHKAIERNAEHRYSNAAELGADVRRFLDDEPIKARRLSSVERCGRLCRRNPLVASMTAIILLLIIGGIGGIFWQWQNAESALQDAVIAREQATAAKLAAEIARREATKQAEAERTARRSRETMLTDMYTFSGLAAGAREDHRQAVLWFAYAARLAGEDRERSEANNTRAASWGRSAVQPVRALVHPAEWIVNMVFHAGGRHLLTHAHDATTQQLTPRLWDLEQEVILPFPGNPSVVSAAAWDAKGERLAVSTSEGEITIYSFPGGEPLQRVSFGGRITRVLFSPDGRFCAIAAANRARVWDCRQAEFATLELKHAAPITTLAFDPQGGLLATACKDHSCRVFNVTGENATPLFAPVRHLQIGYLATGESPLPLLFLDEGRGLLTHSVAGSMSWRDPRTGKVLRLLEFGGASIDAMAINADGTKLALTGTSTGIARVYDLVSLQRVGSKLEQRAIGQYIYAAAFSPDGKMLLTGSSDNSARLWFVSGTKGPASTLIHQTTVNSVAFTPDGRHMATAQRGGLVRLWALPVGNPRDYRVEVGAPSLTNLSHDGRFLLPTGLNQRGGNVRSTQVFNLATGQPAGPSLQANGLLMDAAFSPDGAHVAAVVSLCASSAERYANPGQQPGQLLLWKWQTGMLQHQPLQLPSEPRSLNYSPDGRQLAVLCARGELVVIDPHTGIVRRQWQVHQPHLGNNNYINNGAVRFCPDNRSLITFGTLTNSARVWDSLTGELQHEFAHKGRCYDVQFSSDGQLAATAGLDNWVHVWELKTGKQLRSLAHPDWTYTAHFSPNGQHLLTACRDKMARLWDWRSESLVCPAFEHEHEVHAVAYTSNGRHVVSASDDKTLRIWEWRTGKPVCPPLALGGMGLSLAMAPDGRRVACGGFMIGLPVFHLEEWLAPRTLSPDELCSWGEIVSGQRIQDGGGVTNLTAEEWLKRWQAFGQRPPVGNSQVKK